jgi:hypothetical protein
MQKKTPSLYGNVQMEGEKKDVQTRIGEEDEVEKSVELCIL